MLCISTSGAIGRYITMPPPLTIWWRALFALIFLGVFCALKQYKFSFDYKKYGLTFFTTGLLMTIHWITYFFALQWSNVAIGMLSMFTYPAITAILEPLILKTKFQYHHLILCLMVLLGVYFLAPELSLNNSVFKGLLMGLISAISYSFRNILLKNQVKNFNGSILMFYQMLVMLIILIPVLFIYPNELDVKQMPFIIILGLITTAIGHTLFLNSFKHFSITTASILSGMQPIYGILLGIIFLHEFPGWRSWIGGTLILMTVIVESLWNEKEKIKQ